MVTARSSKMSPSGFVITRLVYPLPAPLVNVCTRLAPISRSLAFVVVTEPLLLVAVLPCAPTATSRALTVSIPLYSAMRISGKLAAVVNVTVTLFAPAAAAAMFLA